MMLIRRGRGSGVAAPSGKKLGWSFWLCIGWLTVVILGAIFANLLPLPDPTAALGAPQNLGPSIHHLLGTDKIGQDVLSQIVFGSRVSLAVGFGATAIGLVIGGGLGLVSGFVGGWIDAFLNSVSLIFLSFPGIILAIALVTFAGHKLGVIVVALGIVATPLVFRLVRTSAQSFAQREFVAAARALGASGIRIVFREILPNVATTLVAYLFMAVGIMIFVEAALSFIGVSVPPPTPTWGVSIDQAVSDLQSNSILWIWPSLALFFTILSLNVAGDAIRKFFGVKESFL